LIGVAGCAKDAAVWKFFLLLRKVNPFGGTPVKSNVKLNVKNFKSAHTQKRRACTLFIKASKLNNED